MSDVNVGATNGASKNAGQPQARLSYDAAVARCYRALKMSRELSAAYRDISTTLLEFTNRKLYDEFGVLYCWPSQDRLAKISGRHEKRVLALLQRLVNIGVIAVAHQGGRDGHGTSRYRFEFDWLTKTEAKLAAADVLKYWPDALVGNARGNENATPRGNENVPPGVMKTQPNPYEDLPEHPPERRAGARGGRDPVDLAACGGEERAGSSPADSNHRPSHQPQRSIRQLEAERHQPRARRKNAARQRPRNPVAAALDAAKARLAREMEAGHDD